MQNKIELEIFPFILVLVVVIFGGLSMIIPQEVMAEHVLPSYNEVTTLPNFVTCDSSRTRVENFVEFLTPIIQYENDLILRDRDLLNNLLNKNKFNPEDSLWLEKKSIYYKIRSFSFTVDQIHKLSNRIDIIPKEIVLAQAAVESNWGKSAFATKHNNLFGTRTTSKENGVVPKKRGNYETFRVASYRTVNQSIRSYLRNLNTHKAYQDLRDTRAEMRIGNYPLESNILADNLTAYSTLGFEYVQLIKRTMRNYQAIFIKNIDKEI